MCKTYNEATSVPAIIPHIHSIGSLIRIDLKLKDSEEFFEVEFTFDQFVNLGIQAGNLVYVDLAKMQYFTNKGETYTEKRELARELIYSVGVK